MVGIATPDRPLCRPVSSVRTSRELEIEGRPEAATRGAGWADIIPLPRLGATVPADYLCFSAFQLLSRPKASGRGTARRHEYRAGRPHRH